MRLLVLMVVRGPISELCHRIGVAESLAMLRYVLKCEIAADAL